MSAAARGRALSLLAVVLALLAVSDYLKPLRLEGADTGLVFFGRRLTGTAGLVAGLGVGTYLALYAAGVWSMRRWALGMAWCYAAYVTVNLVLFPLRTPQPPDAGLGYAVFGIVYTLLAVGGAVACALLLGRRAAELR
jgi:hypothetical protein